MQNFQTKMKIIGGFLWSALMYGLTKLLIEYNALWKNA